MQKMEFQLVEHLFRQYYKILRAYAFRLVNDLDAAEDIVQDVFVALWNKRADLHEDGTIKSYLFRAVYNKSLNYLNSKKYAEEDSLELFIDRLNVLRAQDVNQENLFLVKELQEEIGIKAGGEFSESMMQYDVASTMAYIFGLETPQVWIGRPMKQVFKK